MDARNGIHGLIQREVIEWQQWLLLLLLCTAIDGIVGIVVVSGR